MALHVRRNGLVNCVLGASASSRSLARRPSTRCGPSAAALLAVRLGHGDLPRRAAERADKSLYEAAEIDGASKWQQFCRITVPLITPVIFFNVIMQMVQAFQEFNGPYMITEGGPLKSTYLLPLYIYDRGFKNFKWATPRRSRGCCSPSSWCSPWSRSGRRSNWVFYAGEKRS